MALTTTVHELLERNVHATTTHYIEGMMRLADSRQALITHLKDQEAAHSLLQQQRMSQATWQSRLDFFRLTFAGLNLTTAMILSPSLTPFALPFALSTGWGLLTAGTKVITGRDLQSHTENPTTKIALQTLDVLSSLHGLCAGGILGHEALQSISSGHWIQGIQLLQTTLSSTSSLGLSIRQAYIKLQEGALEEKHAKASFLDFYHELLADNVDAMGTSLVDLAGNQQKFIELLGESLKHALGDEDLID